MDGPKPPRRLGQCLQISCPNHSPVLWGYLQPSSCASVQLAARATHGKVMLAASMNGAFTAHHLFLSVSFEHECCALPLHCPVNACCSFTSSKHFYTYSCLFIDHNAQESMTQAEHSKEGAPQIIEGEAAEKSVFKRLVGQCLEV